MISSTERMAVWGLVPDDLRALGYGRDPRHLYGCLFRFATWGEGGPRLSRPAREFVEEKLDMSLPRIVAEVPSADGSTRFVIELGDGARVEAVHMPRPLKRPRTTICLSSQVGCAMGCTFCATAQMGLVRSLRPYEIVGQLFTVLRKKGPLSAQTLNVVFMGMGEPLHDVDALVRALDVLCEPAGLGLPPSRITVSTSGLVNGIDRLARVRFVPELAVSVNGATSAVRRSLMPIDKKWPLSELRAALDRFPRRSHQKITLEYVLLAGVNDALTDADALAGWIGDLRHIVNVIPFNAWGAVSPYREPSSERIMEFVARLRAHGCLVTVRHSRGRDVRAACGTLVTPVTEAAS